MVAAAEVVVLAAVGEKMSLVHLLRENWSDDDGRLLKICVPGPF